MVGRARPVQTAKTHDCQRRPTCYRNASAHSRELLGHERAFLEGIAGIIRTKVTMHRSAMDSNRKHYPVIESVRDSFGNAATQLDPNGIATLETHITLQVGDVVTFEANGWDAQGRDLSWRIGKAMVGRQMDTATGNGLPRRFRTAELVFSSTLPGLAVDNHSGLRWACGSRVLSAGAGCCRSPRCSG